MPYESSEDSSNQPDGCKGSPRCPPWPPGTPCPTTNIKWSIHACICFMSILRLPNETRPKRNFYVGCNSFVFLFYSALRGALMISNSIIHRFIAQIKISKLLNPSPTWVLIQNLSIEIIFQFFSVWLTISLLRPKDKNRNRFGPGIRPNIRVGVCVWGC